MKTSDRQAIDAAIAAHLDEGNTHAAAEVIITSYGPGLFQFFLGVFHNESVADDVFQHFSVELWRSLSSFQGRSAIFTWVYTLARRSVTWQLRRPERRERNLLTVEEEALQERWRRSATAEWRKTETKERFRAMCEDLKPDDKVLVMLRIGKRMNWQEIAAITHEGDAPLDDQGLKKSSAALRQRFQRIKGRLKKAMAKVEESSRLG